MAAVASGLPIDTALPELTAALAGASAVVLEAPPGAGKSTVVPLALLDEPWMARRRLILLEPRRLAARAVARQMAHRLGEPVGETVGYRMRLDTRVSPRTRIEVVTEGVLTRLLQDDAALEGVGALVFDEFHERSLQADLGLALALDARATLGTDWKVLVMSATLDGGRIAKLLGDAPIVMGAGQLHPVETRYVGKGPPALPLPGAHLEWERSVARAVRTAVTEEEGDVLVFLPGAREIRRVADLLAAALERSAEQSTPRRRAAETPLRILPLYGELSAEAQDAALTPLSGVRRVVLATNIAETSLTIPGVRIVVDAGLAREAVFDPATGMSRLTTQKISRASADQRRGRAGRLVAGVCYRLWSESAQRSLAPHTPAEILAADLTGLTLELAAWGARDAAELRWLDPPPAAMLGSARDLLDRLGALDGAGRITPLGRTMAALGMHPRLAHMLVLAAHSDCLPLGSRLAALLSERDLLHGVASGLDADISTRLDALGGDAPGARRALANAHEWARRVSRTLASRERALGPGVAATAEPMATRTPVARDAAPRGLTAGVLLAFAYPDRIGRRRPGTEARYTLANGRGVYFPQVQRLSQQEFIVAVDVDDHDRDARIRLAAELAREDIETHLAHLLVTQDRVEWITREQAVAARRTVRLGAIVLEERALLEPASDEIRRAMLQGIREMGLEALPWSDEARMLQARIEFARKLDSTAGAAASDETSRRDGAPGEVDRSETRERARRSSWPEVSDAALREDLEGWLEGWLDGISRREHLSRLSMTQILKASLSWEDNRRLDELAPTHLRVPSGSGVPIDYLDDGAPAVAVRLQEVFGLDVTPRIGAGRVPVLFKLLSPARRPVQVTRDLASFWRGAYAEVRKDLRGRYPRHYWPENPLEAEATRRVRPR